MNITQQLKERAVQNIYFATIKADPPARLKEEIGFQLETTITELIEHIAGEVERRLDSFVDDSKDYQNGHDYCCDEVLSLLSDIKKGV